MIHNFKDHFSQDSDLYRRYRPRYPAALYRYLAGLTECRDCAWDCGTGSGQAARGLSEYFGAVIATDASRAQLAQAETAANIVYRVAPAERSGLETGSVDLATVAQAVHWFDLDRFAGEVARVLRPGGILAAWSYDLLGIEPELDGVINHFHDALLGEFWPRERSLIKARYSGIVLPFDELEAPEFMMTMEWTLAQLVGYLTTWSAVRRYRLRKREDPIAVVLPTLERLWGRGDTTRTVRWPLTVKIWVMAD